jgi:hypothetical protein
MIAGPIAAAVTVNVPLAGAPTDGRPAPSRARAVPQSYEPARSTVPTRHADPSKTAYLMVAFVPSM